MRMETAYVDAAYNCLVGWIATREGISHHDVKALMQGVGVGDLAKTFDGFKTGKLKTGKHRCKTSWTHLRSVLGAFWSVLGASWDCLVLEHAALGGHRVPHIDYSPGITKRTKKRNAFLEKLDRK